MINPNRGATQEILERLKEASYERMRIELLNSINCLMDDFKMTWSDLADNLHWENFPCKGYMTGEEIRKEIGDDILTLDELNDIAHCFSAEAYILFKPRPPYTKT